MALAHLRSGHSAAATTVLAAALDATGLDDGRESARIIAELYRQLHAGEKEPDPMTIKERDDADDMYGRS